MKNFSYSPVAIAIWGAAALCPTFALADNSTSSTDNATIETMTVVGKDKMLSPEIKSGTGLNISADETPQSITVVDAQTMTDRNMTSINDVLDNVIGISMLHTDNVRTQYQSRGFDITNFQIDGTPYSWSDTAGDMGETQMDMSVFETVEVVRGSTGLTTGIGDPSASINLVHKHADSADFKGNVEASLGSWNNRSLMMDVQSGLNDDGSLRGRFVAKTQQSDSYSDYYNTKRNVLYGVVEKDITDETLVRVGVNYQRDDSDGVVWGGLPGVYSNGNKTNFSRSQSTAAKWTYWNTQSVGGYADLEHSMDNGWKWKAHYNHTENQQWSKLLYVYADSTDLDEDNGSGLASYPYKSKGEVKQDSLDLHLDGQYALFDRWHDFTVGGLYSRQTRQSQYYDALGDNAYMDVSNFYAWDGNFAEPEWATSSTAENDLKVVQKGLYAATRFNVRDDLKLIVGGRIASWQQTGMSYDEDVSYGKDGIFMPYAGALYDINDQTRVYASYATIFQPQNAQDRNGKFLDPIEGDTYEVGMKNRYFDDKVQFSVALFRIEEDNLAQDDEGYYVPGSALEQAETAADEAVSKGFEVQVASKPTEGLDVNLGYTQFKAEDKDGTEINTEYARKQLKFFSSYRFVEWMPKLTVGAGVRWQSRTYVSDVSQSAYSLVDMMVKYQVTKKLGVNLNIDNLFDKKYYNYLDSGNQVRYGAPLNATLSMNYSF